MMRTRLQRMKRRGKAFESTRSAEGERSAAWTVEDDVVSSGVMELIDDVKARSSFCSE